MKSLKTILGIALSVGGLGTAATVTGVSIAQGNRAVVDSAVEATTTNGKYRINVLTNASRWLQDGVSTLFKPSGSNVVMTKDSDFSASTTNSNYAQVTIGGTTYNWQTYELSSRNSLTTTGNSWFGRGTPSNTDGYNWFDSGISLYTNFRENYYDNTIIINGSEWNFSATAYGWYVKACLHTGLNLENSSTIFMNSAANPDPSTPFGYQFDGWYTESSFTNKWTSGSQYKDINLYAKYSLKKEAYIAGDMNSWSTNNDDYLMSPASDNQYYFDLELEKNQEFKIVYNGAWIGWEQVDLTSKVVTNNYIVKASDVEKPNIKAATAGKYEIYFKTTATGDTKKIWIQQDSEAAATTWAQSFLDATDSICSTGAGGTSENHLSQLSAIWPTHSGNYKDLTVGAQDMLKIGTANETIADAHDRYVHIMTRYAGQLTAFGDWTVGGSGSGANAINTINNNNSGIFIVVVSAVVIAGAAGAFFILRKKKHN